MSLTWEQVIVDSIAPVDLGYWWCAAMGWVVVNDDPGEFEIRPAIDRDAEVQRLLGLGAIDEEIERVTRRVEHDANARRLAIGQTGPSHGDSLPPGAEPGRSEIFIG